MKETALYSYHLPIVSFTYELKLGGFFAPFFVLERERMKILSQMMLG